MIEKRLHDFENTNLFENKHLHSRLLPSKAKQWVIPFANCKARVSDIRFYSSLQTYCKVSYISFKFHYFQ